MISSRAQVSPTVAFVLFLLLCLALSRPGPAVGQAPGPAIDGLAQPDLDVEFIQRFPTFPYNGPKKQPAAGEAATFIATISNRGTAPSGSFEITWFLDGAWLPVQTHAGLNPGETDQLSLPWSWQAGVHLVGLAVDPGSLIGEANELNNQIIDRTDALALGIWVEQSFYDYYNAHIWEAGWGGNSFADWVQRHVVVWNQMMAGAIHPLTPEGILDRIRLEKVVIVPDGSLQCDGNMPADDPTVDLMWGFFSEGVGVTGAGCDFLPYYRDRLDFQTLDRGLLHELSHARYLIDLYGLNVNAHPNLLTQPVGPQETEVALSEVPDIAEYQPPVYLVIEGEILVCETKEDLRLKGCQRGAEGTTARPHEMGAQVFADKILVQDGLGNALLNSPALAPWAEYFFYKTQYFETDLMDGDMSLSYGEHSAYAWNRIAGQRPTCGNYNSPCNIGEYLAEIPEDNVLELRRPDGSLADGGYVEVYLSKPFPVWYGKSYDSTPDRVVRVDENGQASLGEEPFGEQIEHTYEHSSGVILLKFVVEGRISIQFFDITRANLAYWRGERERAVYPIELAEGIAVQEAAPQVDFDAQLRSGSAPLQVDFQAASSGGIVSRYEWDFGDGTSGLGPQVSHHYLHPGVYPVGLRAYGPGGYDQVEKLDYIKVTEAAWKPVFLPIVEN